MYVASLYIAPGQKYMRATISFGLPDADRHIRNHFLGKISHSGGFWGNRSCLRLLDLGNGIIGLDLPTSLNAIKIGSNLEPENPC
jgi:hypothetical protein